MRQENGEEKLSYISVEQTERERAVQRKGSLPKLLTMLYLVSGSSVHFFAI